MLIDTFSSQPSLGLLPLPPYGKLLSAPCSTPRQLAACSLSDPVSTDRVPGCLHACVVIIVALAEPPNPLGTCWSQGALQPPRAVGEGRKEQAAEDERD